MSTDSSIQASDDDQKNKEAESVEELVKIEKSDNKDDSKETDNKDFSKDYINVPKLLTKNKPLNTTYTP